MGSRRTGQKLQRVICGLVCAVWLRAKGICHFPGYPGVPLGLGPTGFKPYRPWTLVLHWLSLGAALIGPLWAPGNTGETLSDPSVALVVFVGLSVAAGLHQSGPFAAQGRIG